MVRSFSVPARHLVRAGRPVASIFVAIFVGGLASVGVPRATWAQSSEPMYILEAEVIQGTLDKPEAFYILSPSSLRHVSTDEEESFMEALWRSVEESEF